MPRVTPVLVLAAAASVTLSACCGKTWTLSEEAQGVVVTARGAPLDLTVRYEQCGLSPSMKALLEQARLVYADTGLALVDLQARIGKALSEEEKRLLAERRDLVIDTLAGQVHQLTGVVDATTKGSSGSIAVVLSATGGVSSVDSSAEARLDYVTVIAPLETPKGIVVRNASARLALAAIVDRMIEDARKNDLLRPETLERLKED